MFIHLDKSGDNRNWKIAKLKNLKLLDSDHPRNKYVNEASIGKIEHEPKTSSSSVVTDKERNDHRLNRHEERFSPWWKREARGKSVTDEGSTRKG